MPDAALKYTALNIAHILNDPMLSQILNNLSTAPTSSIPWNGLNHNSSVYQLVNWYNDHVIGNNSNTVNILGTKGKIPLDAALTQQQINTIKNNVQTHIDSLRATSQQTYLDIQQAMNAYNLAISSWTQILQVLGRSLDQPLRSIG